MAVLALDWGTCGTGLWGAWIARVLWLPWESWWGYVPGSWSCVGLGHCEREQGEGWRLEQVSSVFFRCINRRGFGPTSLFSGLKQ